MRSSTPKAPKIHLALDRGPYKKSNYTKQKAEELGLVLHFLPTYSPNLNSIKRLWKAMNEYVRNNKVFKNA